MGKLFEKVSFKSAILCTALIMFVAYGCKQGRSNNSNSDIMLVTNSADESGYDIILPPVDLLFDLQNVDLAFNSENVNPANNIDKYLSQRSKTLNLGVYLADLSYLSSMEDRSLMPKYMQNIKALCDELKIIGLFDLQTINRYRNGMDNNDSIYYLSLETHERMVELLESTNRKSTLVHIYLGGFIESLYLFIEPIMDSTTFTQVENELENYRFVFNEYYGYAKKMMSDPFLGETVKDLAGLIKEFDKFEAKIPVNDETQQGEKVGNDVQRIINGTDYNIPYADFVDVRNKVIQLREHFVQLK